MYFLPFLRVNARRLDLILLVTLCLGLFSAGADAAMYVRSYSPAKHSRFYTGPDKQFIGTAYDASGVGLSVTNGGWAVMISEHYFVTAAHARPYTGVSNPLRFYLTNDPNGPYEEHVYLTASDGQRIGASDLWLGRLNTAPSAAVARYPILDLPTTGDYRGLEIYTYGKDVGGNGDPTSQRLGRNVIDAGTISSMFSFTYDNPGLGDDESLVFSGDSGGPSFVVVNGQFTLVGLHASKWTTGSTDTFVPRWIDPLNTAMIGEQVSLVTSIPEPSALAVIVLGIPLVGIRRRRGTTLSITTPFCVRRWACGA